MGSALADILIRLSFLETWFGFDLVLPLQAVFVCLCVCVRACVCEHIFVLF